MADNEIALISLQQAATSAVKQCVELKIDFSSEAEFVADADSKYLNTELSFPDSENIVNNRTYRPAAKGYNHNAFMLSVEENENKIGGNFLYRNDDKGERKFFATERQSGDKQIFAFVSTTPIWNSTPDYYGIKVVVENASQYDKDALIRFRFLDKDIYTIDGELVTEREVYVPIKGEYNILSVREKYPVMLLSVNMYKEFRVTNETAGDFIIEDQIATTDSGLEFGLYASTAKVSCFVNETIKDALFDKTATVSLYRPIDKYSREELKVYNFTTAEIEETSDNLCTIQLKNRITEMQDEYLEWILPTEELTIRNLLDFCLGYNEYDILDNNGELTKHIDNTVVKNVYVESKSKYDFLLELCQIGMFNISFDKRFKIWRVF